MVEKQPGVLPTQMDLAFAWNVAAPAPAMAVPIAPTVTTSAAQRNRRGRRNLIAAPHPPSCSRRPARLCAPLGSARIGLSLLPPHLAAAGEGVRFAAAALP